MELSDVQKKTVATWVAEGCGLSEIQRRLTSEFKISATYMDVRLLLIDLGLEVKESQSKSSSAGLDLRGPAKGPPKPAEDEQGDLLEGELDEGPAGGGQVSVEVDRITRPGAVVSGTVKFSDGVSAKWALDQTGRLALDAGKPGYRPSQEDVQSFQMVLSRKLQQQGF